jgi:hypothetical protein
MHKHLESLLIPDFEQQNRFVRAKESTTKREPCVSLEYAQTTSRPTSLKAVLICQWWENTRGILGGKSVLFVNDSVIAADT